MAESIIAERKSLSKFNSLYRAEKFPSSYSIFAPEDSCFDVLHPVELSYLKTRFAHQDRSNLLFRHACQDILYTKDLRKGGTISSLEGERLHYKLEEGNLLIDGANITTSDVVARNGIPILIRD